MDLIYGWIDTELSRRKAIEEAFQRTESALWEDSTSNVTGQRTRMIRDQVISDAQMKEITSMDILRDKLKISSTQLDHAFERTLQLFPDVKAVNIFGFRYLYSTSLTSEELRAATILKQDYIRKAKGRDNRVGHNWEACVEWFVDKFTAGAKFLTQNHRDESIDERRIILHLVKPVGDRRRNAEIDRVWAVKSGPFSPEISYVLQSKWGVILKRYLDDHLEVLRWSQEFGVDTENGREIKQGVVAIFAGTAFNPEGKIRIGDSEITLAQYAARMKIDLIKASDLNEQLHKKGVIPYVTVQKMCELSKNETEVKDILSRVWNQPEKAKEFLDQLAEKNMPLFVFEKTLEQVNTT